MFQLPKKVAYEINKPAVKTIIQEDFPLPDNNKNKNIDLLVEVTRWPRGVAAYLGFWPFFIDEKDGNNYLKFSWTSCPSFASIVVFLIFFCNFYTICFYGKELFSLYSFVTPMEHLGYSLVGWITSVSIMYILRNNVKSRKEIIGLWKSMEDISHEFFPWINSCCDVQNDEKGMDDNEDVKKEYQKWVQDLRRFFKILCITILFNSMLYGIISSTPQVQGLLELFPLPKALYYSSVIVSWAYLTLFQTVYFAVLISLITVIGLCFKIMTRQVSHELGHFSFGNSVGKGEVKFISRNEVLNGKLFAPVNTFPKKGDDGEAEKKVLFYLRLSDDLEMVIEEFNRIMKTQLIIISLYAAIPMVFSVFFVLISMRRNDYLLYQIGLAIALVLNASVFYFLASASTFMTAEAQRFGSAIGKICLTNISPETVALIQMFSVQRVLEPPKISPGHYFVLDNRLITSTLATLTTYLVVLLQVNGVSPVQNKVQTTGTAGAETA